MYMVICVAMICATVLIIHFTSFEKAPEPVVPTDVDEADQLPNFDDVIAAMYDREEGSK